MITLSDHDSTRDGVYVWRVEGRDVWGVEFADLDLEVVRHCHSGSSEKRCNGK